MQKQWRWFHIYLLFREFHISLKLFIEIAVLKYSTGPLLFKNLYYEIEPFVNGFSNSNSS